MMTSECGPRRPNLNETKMRRRYDVACRVGWCLLRHDAIKMEVFVGGISFSFFVLENVDDFKFNTFCG